MNRKQLILILIVLAVLGGASILLLQRDNQSWTQPQGNTGGKLLPGFQVGDVAAIHIKAAEELHLVRKDGSWRVQERGDYPANASQINEMLLKIAELKILQTEPIGPSELARMELEPPGKGAGSATLLEFGDASGKTLSSILLGKKHSQPSQQPSAFGGDFPDGRYVMLPSDSKEVILISDPLTGVEPRPASWLNMDFFKIEKPETISLVSTNATNSWKLTHDADGAPWSLVNTNAGEVLDQSKASSTASALSYPGFIDVATGATPAETGMDKPTVVTISTFDHFTYDIKIGRKTPDNNYYFAFSVTADFPTQRTPGKDEKPEDKQKLDKEFQDKTKALQDKLTQEKAMGKWVYIVSSGLIEPILRDRSQMFVEKKEEAPAGESGGTANPKTESTLTNMPTVAPATTNAAPGTPPK